MCGITAVYDPQKRAIGDEEGIAAGILEATKHRGPDGTDTVVLKGATIGANRLAIVDPHNTRNPRVGRNPITHIARDGSEIVIAMNGEIYNWKELRAELENEGCKFLTDCDTEVAAAAWDIWGVDFPHRLRGMFAITLKDEGRDKFVVVTDHVSQIPLCSVEDKHGRTIYSSESGPLQKLGKNKGEVSKVKAGQIIVNGAATTWWDIMRPPIAAVPPTTEELRKVIVDTVMLHLPPAGEKFGVFLSGGFDSGAIANIAVKEGRKEDLVVFISGRPGSSDAEGALKLARKLGLSNKQIVRVELEPKAVFDALPDMVKHFNDPDYFQSANGANFFFCAQAAKKAGINKILCGDGSDEIFAGYSQYRGFILNKAPHFYENNPPSVRDLYSGEELTSRCLFEKLPSERIACVNLMPLAHSVEPRTPFLDKWLLEAGFSVPMEDKIDIVDGKVVRGKSCAREAMRGYLEDMVVDSIKTPGFIGGHTFASAEAINPYASKFDPVRDAGTVRAMMRQAIIDRFGDIDGWKKVNYFGWDVGCPEQAYLTLLWMEQSPEMARAYPFYAAQRGGDKMFYMDDVLPDFSRVPADALIATRGGPKRASEVFPKHRFGNLEGSYAKPKTPTAAPAALPAPVREPANANTQTRSAARPTRESLKALGLNEREIMNIRFGAFYAQHRAQYAVRHPS